MKTRVYTITCPICKSEFYSRAHHDFRGCECGTFIDGGFEYQRIGVPKGYKIPKRKVRYVKASKKELYDDWNSRTDQYGIITYGFKKC